MGSRTPTLYNTDGTVGTKNRHEETGRYCETCGSETPQQISMYHPQTETWERGVPCPMHWPHPH